MMVSPEEVAASEAATGLGSPAVKADAVAKSSGPAVSRDAARRVKGVARRGGPLNRKKIVKKRIVKRDKEVKKLVSYIGQLKLLRESLSRTDPQRPTFQEYTRARADLRRKLPPGTVGDKQYDEFVGVACTTCDDRDAKGKEVVRAFAALRAVRKRRKPGGPLPVVLKPAASAARSEREELEAKFRHIREEDERLEEEERRPPAVMLKGRAVGPAVPQERGETSAKRVVKAKTEDVKKCPAGHSLKDFATTSDGWTCSMCEREYPENSLFRRCSQCDYDLCAACWCVAKRPGDKETEDEAPPPPPPSGKPRSRRAREVKDDDDDESTPPPPPGKPPRSVRSSRNKAKDEAEGRATEPAEASEPAASSPVITFPWGSWVCPKCNGVNVPHSKVCGHQFEGGPCTGSFWEATEWAPHVEPAVPGGTREERREERRRVKVQALDLALRHGTWMCRRCGGDNLKSRIKCYKCSTIRTRQRGADESESSGDSEREKRVAESVVTLMASFARPRGRKRGGARHKKSTPKKKAKKKKVCRCGKSHKAVRPRHFVPAGRLCLKGFKSWLVAKKARNRLVHALNGNIAYWHVARMSFLLGFVPLVPLVYRTEQELEQTVSVVLESAAVATSEILDEVGSSARLVVRVMFQLGFFVILAVLWAVSRAWRNRLMHALVGNIPCKLLELTKDGESTWEVKGSRATYKVWISQEGGRNGCSCRVFLDEGTCGHIDAAVSVAKEQKILETKVRFTSTAAERGLAALGSPSIRPSSGASSCLPFDAIARKAKGLVKKESKGEESGCFSGITSRGSKKEPTPPAPSAETLAIEDAPAVISDAEKSSKDCGVLDLLYLDGKEALEKIAAIVLSADHSAEVRVRAYSFDQPDVLISIKQALSRSAKVWIVCDSSQANGKTKQQLQGLKELREAGAQIRVCCGVEINAAYVEDQRSVRVGSKLKGLHHSKTVLVRYFHTFKKSAPAKVPPVDCVVGSCNLTTSSKANRESGVYLRLVRGTAFEKDWVHAFETAYQSGETVEEFEIRIAASAQSSFRRSPTVERE